MDVWTELVETSEVSSPLWQVMFFQIPLNISFSVITSNRARTRIYAKPNLGVKCWVEPRFLKSTQTGQCTWILVSINSSISKRAKKRAGICSIYIYIYVGNLHVTINLRKWPLMFAFRFVFVLLPWKRVWW